MISVSLQTGRLAIPDPNTITNLNKSKVFFFKRIFF